MSAEHAPVQQSDTLKEFYLAILEKGLNYAYHAWRDVDPFDPASPDPVIPRCYDRLYKHTKTSHPKKVVVVGAGMSGLSAAYELAQVGHDVLILEMQQRVGGRVRTVTEPFYNGLWADCEFYILIPTPKKRERESERELREGFELMKQGMGAIYIWQSSSLTLTMYVS